MPLSPSIRSLPPAWNCALIGTVASLPAVLLLNWLPDWIGQADITAGIYIFGAFVAGVVATRRSSQPRAAGLRAGVIGAVAGVALFTVEMVPTLTWSLATAAFVFVANGLMLIFAPLFGWVFGYLGGLVANHAARQLPTSANTS